MNGLKNKILSLFLVSALFANAQRQPETSLFIENLFHVTEIMVTDVAPPTGAARNYAYATLAAHLAWKYSAQKNDLPNLLVKSNYKAQANALISVSNLNPEFVSIYAMLETAKRIMPSGKLLDVHQQNLISHFLKKKWFTKKQLAEHLSYCENVAQFVQQLAAKDGYNQLSTLTRYTPNKSEGHWYPTPPAYMAAVDPEWRTIKTFFINDLNAFKPQPPAPFDVSPGSSFHSLLEEVYKVTRSLTAEQKAIANFWDCNPFTVSFSGHMAIGTRKISPGGHWISITGIATKMTKIDWEKTIFIHALVAMSLHDAFVSCWQEKYDTDRIRPESAINKYKDQNWRPLLQTPPFPEYTSGHSVISRASARMLTSFFGDNFVFTDTSEIIFGLPERKFTSFLQASDEAAVSRLYGGIHFRDAIEQGVKQGDKIADYILERIK